MTITETIVAEAQSVAAHIRHAALWLIGAITEAKKEIETLEASDPLVATAVTVGTAWATAQGIPVPAIEGAADAVLALARCVAAAAAAPATPSTNVPAIPPANPAA